MKDQNIDLGENNMVDFCFPQDFPSEEDMFSVLKKTFEKSWKVDINVDDIKTWQGNFMGLFAKKEYERRLALWLLCNFTYYNDEEIEYLCLIMYKKFIHKLMANKKITTTNTLEQYLKQLVFVPIGGPSESGGLLLYNFRQAANISTDYFAFPISSMVESKQIIVCIDDVIVSGDTAVRFFNGNQEMFKNKEVYYLTIFASDKAIIKLSQLNICVIECIKLDDRDKVFSPYSLCFSKYPSLRQPCKLIMKGYGKKISSKE